VYRGITSGFNEAFVIDGATRQQLIAQDRKSEELIRPFLRGKDLTRWRAEFSDQYIIKIESSENRDHAWSGSKKFEAEKLFAKAYPAIHARFNSFRKELIERYDQGHYFWELRACAYWKDFELPKIVSTKISIEPTFALDGSGSFIGNTAYFFAFRSHGDYLLSLLNSSVSAFYAKNVFVGKQNGWYEVQPDALEASPVPNVDAEQKRHISTTLSAFLESTDPRFEQLINAFAYELFLPKELGDRKLRFFDEAGNAGLSKLEGLKGKLLNEAAGELAERIFAPSHPLYAMLFDLQTVDEIRIIEDKE
jgi:hypothetical protein